MLFKWGLADTLKLQILKTAGAGGGLRRVADEEQKMTLGNGRA
jgi:hypothetical protein